MKAINIIIIVAAVLIVVGVTIGSIVRKFKAKKSGCRTGCAGCPYANACNGNKTNRKKPITANMPTIQPNGDPNETDDVTR